MFAVVCNSFLSLECNVSSTQAQNVLHQSQFICLKVCGVKMHLQTVFLLLSIQPCLLVYATQLCNCPCKCIVYFLFSLVISVHLVNCKICLRKHILLDVFFDVQLTIFFKIFIYYLR